MSRSTAQLQDSLEMTRYQPIDSTSRYGTIGMFDLGFLHVINYRHDTPTVSALWMF
jgi:hypothetical protein